MNYRDVKRWTLSKWPLVWKETSHKAISQAIAVERRSHEQELAENRKALTALIPRVVKVGERSFGQDGIYSIRTDIDGRMFHGIYNADERRYFAEYVGRHVEAEVARLIVVRPR